MDLTYLGSSDVNLFLGEVAVRALQTKRSPKEILIRAFIGGKNSEQGTPLTDAYKAVAERYAARGITVVLQEFTNDLVKHKYHWTCRELFNALLAADIHLLPTHMHQGMLALGGTDSYNIGNILDCIERLRFHLGVPNGKHVENPVGSQHKMKLYDALAQDNLCAPTISVDISLKDIMECDKIKIRK